MERRWEESDISGFGRQRPQPRQRTSTVRQWPKAAFSPIGGYAAVSAALTASSFHTSQPHWAAIRNEPVERLVSILKQVILSNGW